MNTATAWSDETLRAALARHFGFAAFREGQAEAVRAALEGSDLLLVMPTGSGKSLCYQLAGLLLPGVAIVISPLIALMKDQVDGLVQRGIAATFLNSSLSGAEMEARLHDLRAGRWKLVYVAPERFRNARFLASLSAAPVGLFTVDEAHCISQWGHDFRPDYLNLRNVLRTLPGARAMAVTATATPAVRADIVLQLGMGVAPRAAPLVRVHGFARPNLHLVVTRAATHAVKLSRLQRIVAAQRRGIVYCATRRMTERVGALLRASGAAPLVYHGALPDDERSRVQERFMSAPDPVIVATNAFGMGVDRPDLRFVAHWDLPGSVEAYYQEVGRAGRDGAPAWCELLFNYADVRTQEFFLDGGCPPAADVLRLWEAVRKQCDGGPAALTGEEWAAHCGLKNAMAVRAGLAVLERAGLVARAEAPGNKAAGLALTGRSDVALLKPHLDALAHKRRLDRQKLDDLLAYVDQPACRHAFLLRYFGETDQARRCAACDRCVRRPLTPRAAPNEEQWLAIQKLLSCVGRMQGRHGAARIVQVLRGEEDASLSALGLDKLSTYGLLRDWSAGKLRALLGALQAEGCVTPDGGSERPLALTPRGRRVVRREESLELAWPAVAEAHAATAPVAARRSARGAGAAGLVAAAPSAGDARLLAELKRWRLREAARSRLRAYQVLPNVTLEALAGRKPTTLEVLHDIPGIGPVKAARYGAALLQLIASA